MEAVQEVTKYPHGTFSWLDVSTTDTDGGKAFYTQLFGWSYEDMPMGDGQYYTMFSLHGKAVAALSAMQEQQRAQGMPPHWNSYITVDDVDATTQKAKEAGTTILAEPFDVLDSGRMSVVQDPTGAVFMLWQAKNHIGASLVNMPGTLVWNELATRDAQKAADFYTSVLGWTHSVDDGSDHPYHMFSNNGRYTAGMIEMNEEWGDIPPHWMNYFSVEDTDATAARAKELGGTIHVEPADIPNTGRFAVIQDPQGAVFSVIKMEQVDSIEGLS